MPTLLMAAPKKSSDYKYIKIKVIGGELPGTALSTKVGPLGVPAKLVAEDIRKATADYKGLRVHVELAVKDRKATVAVTPSTSTLIIKALREPPRDRKKEKNILHNGSIKISDVVEIARIKREESQCKSLTAVVKCVLGSCVAVGCKVDGRSPKDITKDIKEQLIIIPEN